jgi:hypothetical protein
MLFGSPCVGHVVYFSSQHDRREPGVEERNQKFLGNERSEYEPKANKLISTFKNLWENDELLLNLLIWSVVGNVVLAFLTLFVNLGWI